MTHQADPGLLYHVRRAAVTRRLVDSHHIDALDVEHWIASWERWAFAQEVDRLDGGFWDASWLWITEQWMSRPRPPAE